MSTSIKAKLVADPSGVIKGTSRAKHELTGFGGALAKLQQRGAGAFSGLASAMSNSGLFNNNFSSIISGVDSAFSTLGDRLESIGEKASKLQKIGATMAGLGAVATAAGAGMTMLGMPLENAQANLQNAIKDTGGSIDQYSAKIGQAQSAMANYGFTSDQVDSALAKLTQATRSPEVALKSLQTAADLAKASHISLTAAADQLARLASGRAGRALSAYGIVTTVSTVTPQVAAAKAVAQHTAALQKLAIAQANLAALQSKGGTSTPGTVKSKSNASTVSHAQKSADASLTRAENALANAQLRLQGIQTKLAHEKKYNANGSTELASAEAKLQNAQQNLTNAQQAATAAGQMQITTTSTLTAGHKTAAASSLSLMKAQLAVQAAQAAVAKSSAAEATATDNMKHPLNKYNKYLGELNQRIHGTAQAQSQTFGGKFDAIKAKVTDMAMEFGKKYGPSITGVSIAATGLGATLDVGAKIAEKFSKGIKVTSEVGSAASDAAKGLSTATDLVTESSTVASGAQDLLAGSEAVEAGGAEVASVATDSLAASVAAVTLPVLAVIAAIALLAVGIYELVKHWKTVMKWLKEGVSDVWHSIDKVWGSILKSAKLGWKMICDAVTLPVHLLIDGVKFYLKMLEDIWIKLPLKILGYLKDAGKWLWNTGKQIIMGLINGIGAFESMIANAMKKIGSSIIHGIGSALGISSPSRKMMEIGQYISQGLAIGIDQHAGKATDAVTRMANQIANVPIGANISTSVGANTASVGAGVGSSTAPVMNVSVVVQGSVTTEQELSEMIYQSLLQKGQKMGSLFQGYA